MGESIRAHRQAAGLTQEELADAISMTQTAVSYWETGKRQPGADDLVSIARALGCTVAELAGDAVSNDVTVKIKADPSQILALTDVLIKHLSALRDDLERLQAEAG